MTHTVNIRRPVTVYDDELAQRCARGRVIVIDDDVEILDALRELLALEAYACETYASAKAYLRALEANAAIFPGPCCVLCDVMMPETSGLELQTQLALHDDTPLLLMSGASGASEVANAFRAGAVDFLIKPMAIDVLLNAVAKALQLSTERQRQRQRRTLLAQQLATLTHREREVARRVAQGQTNGNTADDLGIALRTVKLHRQRALEKLGIDNVAELVRVADECGL